MGNFFKFYKWRNYKDKKFIGKKWKYKYLKQYEKTKFGLEKYQVYLNKTSNIIKKKEK